MSPAIHHSTPVVNWDIVSDHVFMLRFFLEDYPNYRSLFNTVDMPDDMPTQVDYNHVRFTLGARFNASLSIHEPNHMPADLAKFIPHAAKLPPNLEGYMTRFGKRDAKFHIAVKIGDNNKLDRGTVVHEYGHYVEQRVAFLRGGPTDPLAERDTAFMFACAMVSRVRGRSVLAYYVHHGYPADLRWTADELVAWLNALWLCWILNIDPKTVAAGMVLDAINHSALDIVTVTRCLPAIAHIITDRAAAEQLFASAGPYTLGNALRRGPNERDSRLCKQIDCATSMLLAPLCSGEGLS